LGIRPGGEECEGRMLRVSRPCLSNLLTGLSGSSHGWKQTVGLTARRERELIFPPRGAATVAGSITAAVRGGLARERNSPAPVGDVSGLGNGASARV
jgi:hypothetical protein